MGRVGEYEVLETLGQGAYSKVKRVLHVPTGELFVAKIIPKSNQRVENDVRLEISVLRRLKHRNIVQLIEILESSNNYYIILEPVMGGDLCDLLMSSPQPLSERDVAALFIQLVAGVRACHRNGVAHRDLKPENLLLTTTGMLKISDFGLSRLHRESNFEARANEYAHTLTGTLAYVAPEVFARTYDAFRADIWSMGCIAYVLLTQNFPFGSASDPNELERRIRNGEVSSMPDTVSPEAKHLCLWLLSPWPQDRPTLDQVVQHAFFAKNLPEDYLALVDSRRTVAVEDANADEFSSRVQDDTPPQCGNSAASATSTPAANSPSCANAAAAADPTLTAKGEGATCTEKANSPQDNTSLPEPMVERRGPSACASSDECRSVSMSSVEKASLRRARPFVK